MLLPALLALLTGCQTTRVVNISTQPPDAMIKINGVDQGRAPLDAQVVFKDANDVHVVTASRRGYKDASVQLTRDDKRENVAIELSPLTRVVYLTVEPVNAIIKIDGEAVSRDRVSVWSRELPFTVDERNNWTSYTVTAERPGYQTASTTVSWPDRSQYYTLRLEPLRKDLNITSNPSGASVYLDESMVGTTTLLVPDRAFPVNIDNDQFIPQTLRLEKPGYDPVELEIAWDDGRRDYHVDFQVKTKQVRVMTEPEGAAVVIDGVEPDREGPMVVYTLEFPPLNEQGDLRKYSAVVAKEPGETEWEPATLEIAWDGGKNDYHVRLKEILTRPVPLTEAVMRRGERGWEYVPQQVTTIAMKDVGEPAGKPTPVLISRPGTASSIGTMAVAPNGEKVLFTLLTSSAPDDLRSQLVLVPTDGRGSAEYLTDGRSLDITPSFTPGGDQILFSSNRAGRRLQIWSISAMGMPGITRLITSETHDLWPALDSDPKPRLFYQAHVDTRPDPRMFMTPMGTVSQTDLTLQSGTQPRVSPKNDAMLFCAVNDQTGKRDIYRMSDRGGLAENLTNSPDSDDCDPVWSRDGTRVAFASDRGVDAEGRRNYDIWMIDVSRPDEPIQITRNGSQDDNPLFDPVGNAIFFRSNRGGEWGVWRVSLR